MGMRTKVKENIKRVEKTCYFMTTTTAEKFRKIINCTTSFILQQIILFSQLKILEYENNFYPDSALI